MIKRFCTEILKLKISSLHLKATLKLEISVLLGSYNILTTAQILPSELLTISLLKFANKNLITKSLIFGVWVVYSTKSPLSTMHLMLKTWKALFKKYWKEHILHCQRSIALTWKSLSPKCWLKTQINVHQSEKFWKCLSWRQKSMNCFPAQ